MAISACYQILDLVCNPSRSTETAEQQQQWDELFTMHFPAPFIAVVDTLGFLGFLALLIANTIVVSHLDMPKAIYIFNSIPWVLIGYVHFPFHFMLQGAFSNCIALRRNINTFSPDELNTNLEKSLYHASIAIQALPSILAQTSGRQRDYCCVDCKRESERRHGKSSTSDGATATLLQNIDGSEIV